MLSFLSPLDLTRAAQTCRYWRILSEDNLLWREKREEAGKDHLEEFVKRRSVAIGGKRDPKDPVLIPPSTGNPMVRKIILHLKGILCF